MTATEIKGLRIPKERAPTQPEKMLLEEFLKPLGMTQTELAEELISERREEATRE